eukprot:TRINITY_DN97016_c0_g1_i1.p1 TRINITY_DN97016_c0_g1~~TRINITY_DN97016_c0_g1_i1.p1  ORF type:complete len:353 (-),score=53.51 TRINITY_DN97016_c0_g1_i1:77-1135(-)
MKKSQAEAAALRRSKNVHRNKNMEYCLWIGATAAAVFSACYAAVHQSTGAASSAFVNDDSRIQHINNNARTWQAKASSFFKGWTIADVKSLEGISVVGVGVQRCTVPDVPVPEEFDARKKWSWCFKHPPQNMGNCSASYAVAAASALSNRFCISNPSEYSELVLSAQYILSCDSNSRGCNGGDIDTVHKFMEQEGLVTEACFPYQGDSSIECHQTCNEAQKKAVSSCLVDKDPMSIKREIFLNGPVVAPLTLSDDLLAYRAGIYEETSTATPFFDKKRNRLIQAVKLIGWGTANGKPYWIIENSWGDDWGEMGYAKISASVPEMKATERAAGLEKKPILMQEYVFSGTPRHL